MFFRLFSPIPIQSCHVMGSKWKQTYSRDETEVIAQSGGRDLLAKSMFYIFQIHIVSGKVDFNFVVKTKLL